jgi:ABC-type oligopeptide transport system ATPase subunit
MQPLLELKSISKNFYLKPSVVAPKKVVQAVQNAEFEVYPNEVFGLIGESGSGKTTISNMIMGIYEPTSGSIAYDGRGIESWLTKSKVQDYRKDVQMVFQQSKEVLDPKRTIEQLLKTPLVIHRIVKPSEIDVEVDRLLTLVGLNPRDKKKKPTAFSGGQLQRICIARALSVRPKLVILDEPVSALDVSVQGQIINLLMALKESEDLTYILISHDLNVVKHMCNRIAVMKSGQIVEIDETKKIFNNPKALYTKKLIFSTILGYR